MSPLDRRQRDLVKCEDMRIYGLRAVEFLGALSKPDFLSDVMLQEAIIRCVEVVGEAARQVSDQTRQLNPQIPWSMIIGMRNVLAHDYGGVDLDQVHGVVVDHLPGLLAKLEALIGQLEDEVGWETEDEEDDITLDER